MNKIRAIALYLPQFHPIPENDEWWGKGFTEWTNVVKAKPQFRGHYQPHLPGDLGLYDLRLSEVREAQAKMAQDYGIYGFCYYHYWFNGKHLLDFPLKEMLRTGKPKFPFCICWANENWTRRWDGLEKDVLLAQHYSDEDSLNFINDLAPAFRDQRYIRVNGKPVLLLYRTGLLPNPKRTTEIWRDAMLREGVGDLYLVRVENSMDGLEVSPEKLGFDAAVEFTPNWGLLGKMLKNYDGEDLPVNIRAYDYENCMKIMLTRPVPRYKLFRGIFPGWDNTPRRKSEPTIILNSSPEKFAYWLSLIFKLTIQAFDGDERLVFINAWNEWGEGCHLEPDEKFGLRFLETVRLAHGQALDFEKLITGTRSPFDPKYAFFDSWFNDFKRIYSSPQKLTETEMLLLRAFMNLINTPQISAQDIEDNSSYGRFVNESAVVSISHNSWIGKTISNLRKLTSMLSK